MKQLLLRAQITRKKRPARLPRQIPPAALARAYRTRIRDLIDSMMSIFRSTALGKLEALAAQLTTDAVEDDLAEIFEELQQKLNEEFNRRKLQSTVRPVAAQLASYQATQLNRQINAVTGTDLVGFEGWLEKEIALFTSENVALIKSIPQEFLSKLEPALARHFSNGGKFEDMAQLIEDQFEVSSNRAKLIATDQTYKFNANLNELRQKDLGIDKFTWVTEEDEKVRSSHAARNGKVMSWENPLGGILPGEEVNCRCEAEPYFGDLVDAD